LAIGLLCTATQHARSCDLISTAVHSVSPRKFVEKSRWTKSDVLWGEYIHWNIWTSSLVI